MAALISELEAETSQADLTKQALLEGLRHLELVLRYLRFFGHRAASTDLLQVQALTIEAIQEEPKGSSRPVLDRIWNFAGALGLLITLASGPDQVGTALTHYRTALLGPPHHHTSAPEPPTAPETPTLPAAPPLARAPPSNEKPDT